MDLALPPPPELKTEQLTQQQSAILKVLLYFNIFQYPLFAEEIKKCLPTQEPDQADLKDDLLLLEERRYVFHSQGFYAISPDTDMIVRRVAGNKKAQEMLNRAKPYIRLISYFPFVEAVFISGSIAKGMVDKKGDVDYFIITRPGRLWVCRTMLMLFKKVFLLNSKKYFCANYFIDSDNLLIPDQNLFTATEVAFLKPVYNPELCRRFFEHNTWKNKFYPSMPVPDTSGILRINHSWIKRFPEWLFGSALGERMDRFFLKVTLNRWKTKFPSLKSETFDLNFRSSQHVSKHHPGDFQNKVMGLYNSRLKQFEANHLIGFYS